MFVPYTRDTALNAAIEDYFNALIEKDGDMHDCPLHFPYVERVKACKKVVITGPVGVGKTSIVNEVIKYLDDRNVNYILVPEYIDVLPDANDRLTSYLQGKISSYDFQRYVSVYYAQYLKQIAERITPKTILIFERVPDDALWCFVKMDYMKGLISPDEREMLSKVINKMNVFLNLPSYNMAKNQAALIVKSDELVNNAKVVANFICDSAYDRIVIGLFNDTKICHERVLNRARPGEEAYNFNSIFMFNKCYAELYSNIMFT